jgi:hypothetical protein
MLTLCFSTSSECTHFGAIFRVSRRRVGRFGGRKKRGGYLVGGRSVVYQICVYMSAFGDGVKRRTCMNKISIKSGISCR